MFTGIIEAVGAVKLRQPLGGDLRLTIDTGALDLSDVAVGDSIATNGVCLTVVSFTEQSFTADVSQETLSYSQIAHWAVGDPVNLEKALLPTTRLGGHLVSGHVDGVAEILSVKSDARSVRIKLAAPGKLKKYIAAKGSITIDGVSLTVNAVEEDQFELNIVPHTAQTTVIRYYQPQQQVHIEVDMIARYLERLLQVGNDDKASHEGVTEALLASAGYLKGR